MKSTLVFIYNSFKDPLFQNLLLSYLKTLATKGNYAFYVVTFEQDKYKTTRQEQNLIKAELKQYNIYWYPLNFHTGRFLLFKKAYDFITALRQILYLRITKNIKLIFAFANVSAALSIVIAKILRTKFLVYSYEPHSEFMAELGYWNKQSLKYRVLNSLEKYAAREGDYILTGTSHMVKTLQAWQVKGTVLRAPTSIDENKMYFSSEGRRKIRARYNIADKDVLIYLGKFGGLYYEKEIVDLCAVLKACNANFYFLILTPNDHIEVSNLFKVAGLQDSLDFTITESYNEVRDYISAADIGLNAIPPTPAQQYRSPTKVAEYLLCGIPYITCWGISEDDTIAMENEVGVALVNFDRDQVISSYPDITKLLVEDKNEQRNRCRRIGIEYRGKSNIDALLEKIYLDIFKE